MKGEVFVLSQLIQRLKYLEPIEGCLYGLSTVDGNLVLAALSAKSVSVNHDVSLLLPPPLTPVGRFQVCKDNYENPEIEDEEVALIWDQKDLHIFFKEDGDLILGSFTTLSEREFYSKFFIAKVSYKFDLTSKDSAASVKTVINNMREMLESPSACFRLQDTNLLLQNNDDGVLNLGGLFSDVDEAFEEALAGTGKKRLLYHTAAFKLLINRSCASSTYAPEVRIDNRKTNILSVHLNGEAFLYIEKAIPVSNVAKLLVDGIVQQLNLSEYWMNRQLEDKKLRGMLASYTSLHYIAGHLVNLIYPESCDESCLDSYRREVHKSLLFPLDRPMVRRLNRIPPLPENKNSVLTNTHFGVRPSGVAGEISIVPGTYGYHHYMQDHFDDNKWGCAYRSLQTVISWFRYQGYTDKPIPTHKEIQKCLVNIGDKPSSFVGSTQWIGSTEVGFVLDSMFNITSKFINVSSGAELAYKGRELALHFKFQGAPVMIGGGVLAHTIIGVDWNPDTGDISYLILDPHYTGAEEISTIQNKGWCGWKGQDFWKKDAYYNLCLPQRPSCI
ncbi:Ufm1-specific protease 2 [Halocaridina rubra]|uniref:Probable Ufm1-specific protease 2 n=1 Tax=Halocaridina rubra TaxID=373956 RepID=A0AAN9AG37_HALRR